MADNKARLDEVYSKYANLLFRIALSSLQNREDAEDAVQDTFVKYLSSSFYFSGEKEERAWLVRVVTNTCNDYHRRHRVREALPLDEALEIPVANEETKGVFSAISKLSDKYRTVIVLHYLEDFSVDEIAKALSLTRSGVKMRLMRGREELSYILAKGEA